MAFPGHPDLGADRDDLTLAQKKRIAIWQTMGIGLEGQKVGAPSRAPPGLRASGSLGGGLTDRRAIMLEREKRLREQQEKEEEALLEEQRRRLEQRRRGGMQSLGAVQPREEAALPLTQIKVSMAPADGSDDDDDERSPDEFCHCGQRYLPGAKFCSECGARRVAPAPVPESAEEMVQSIMRKEKERQQDTSQSEARLREQQKRWQEPQVDAKKKKKKKKKRQEKDDEEDDKLKDSGASDEDDDDENPQVPSANQERKQPRDGGAYKSMVVPSVKGMVSNDYKGFTDADLERRFAIQSSQSSKDSSLMSEKEALERVRREKTDRGIKSGANRVQRELAEWQAKKKERMARRSRSREHLVMGRK